jgi:hypothetical protein
MFKLYRFNGLKVIKHFGLKNHKVINPSRFNNLKMIKIFISYSTMLDNLLRASITIGASTPLTLHFSNYLCATTLCCITYLYCTSALYCSFRSFVTLVNTLIPTTLCSYSSLYILITSPIPSRSTSTLYRVP